MIKKKALFFACCALVAMCGAACSTLPHVKPVQFDPALCRPPFADKACRYVYSLDAELSGGLRMTAMIVTGIDPASGTIDAAIITLEGLVVFDVTLSRNGMQVHRALPPLNRRRFATRLIRDIRFIFGIHAGQPAMTGFLDDGASVCRYHDVLNSTVDMGVQPDGVRYVEQYSRYGKKLRSLKMHALHNNIPGVVQYTAFSPKPYALNMRLLSVEAFVPDDHNQECKDMQ